MKKLLTLSTVALVALAMGVSAKATTPQTQAAMERRITWDQQHIRQLQHRRAYLHRYIRHLRKTTTPIVTHTAAIQPSLTVPTSSSTGGWADELRAVGFPESAISTMLYIIQRESGGNPSAVNPTSGACGLLQIWPAQPGCLDPMTNLRMGYEKYQAAGFSPWG